MCAKRVADRSFKVFMSDIKSGKLNNAVLMYGPEQYLISWAVDIIKKKYVNPATEAVDFVVMDQDEAYPENIIEACETFSMLSEKRVIWVRNFKALTVTKAPKDFTEDGISSLADYLKGVNPKAIVIFSSEEVEGRSKVVSALKEAGSYYEFVTLSGPELKSFANKRFRDAGVEISPYLMSRLIDATGYDNRDSDYRLFNFENDIHKVIAHSDGRTVTENDIDETVAGDNETFIFDLIDGISGNNKKQALEILYNRLNVDGNDAHRMIATIASQLELMYEIKEFQDSEKGPMNAEEISRYTGTNVYRVRAVMKYGNRYPKDKVRSMLSGIYESHINIITGIMEPQMALELFVASI
jgi:DNA polymerase-3 subunit delta